MRDDRLLGVVNVVSEESLNGTAVFVVGTKVGLLMLVLVLVLVLAAAGGWILGAIVCVTWTPWS